MEKEKIGKYEVLEKIGSGGFAVVYKGYDPFIKRPVAIKVCYSRDRETRRRFELEAEIAGKLEHRNITTVFDFGMLDGMPYLVEEYLAGEDLAHLIHRHEPEAIETKIDFLLQLADGLGYAHAQGVIHRDIKPGNIRVLDDGRLKIMDFGTAKLTHVEHRLTQTGMTLGTVAYLPPERLQGLPTSINADIFSLGVTAYEMIAFRRPFTGKNLPELIDSVLTRDPVRLDRVAPHCPPRLADIVHKCMLKDPTHRYPACATVIADLEGFLEEHTAIHHLDRKRTDNISVAAQVALQRSGLLDRARQLVADGKPERAEILLDEVLEIEPNNEQAQRLLARCRQLTTPTQTFAATPPPPPDSPITTTPSGGTPATGLTTDAPSETDAQRRERKINEAVGTVERYIHNRQLVEAAGALAFAARLFGTFDEVGPLRAQIGGMLRAEAGEMRRRGHRMAEHTGRVMKALRVRNQLPIELAEHFVELSESIEPEHDLCRRLLAKVRNEQSAPSTDASADKRAEAVASIERLLADGKPQMAERALEFAVRLFGSFDQVPRLQQRIARARQQSDT